MAITMGWPDSRSWYQPVFHALALRLLAMGAVSWTARVPGDA